MSKYGVFSGPNAGKCRPEKTPYLYTFKAVHAQMQWYMYLKKWAASTALLTLKVNAKLWFLYCYLNMFYYAIFIILWANSCSKSLIKTLDTTNIYLFKFYNRNTGNRCKIRSKLTKKTPKWHWRRSGIFIIRTYFTLFTLFHTCCCFYCVCWLRNNISIIFIVDIQQLFVHWTIWKNSPQFLSNCAE